MRKQFFIGDNLCAALVRMTAFKHNFTEQIPCHSIDPVELTFISTEWAGVGVLLEPMSLAIAAKRFLTCFALNRVFKNVVANSTDELR